MNINITITDDMRETLAWALRSALLRHKTATDTYTKLMILRSLDLASQLKLGSMLNGLVSPAMQQGQILRSEMENEELQRRAYEQDRARMQQSAYWPFPPMTPQQAYEAGDPQYAPASVQPAPEAIRSGGGGDFAGGGADGTWDPLVETTPAPSPSPSYDSGSYDSGSSSSSDSSSSSSTD